MPIDSDFIILRAKYLELIKKVDQEISSGKIVYPPKDKILAAWKYISLETLKVVIVGQDPYHGDGQANGLAFSVNPGIPIPPSLRNIFIELYQDLQIQPAPHGDLIDWSKQGVLLLNRILTVEKDKPRSHANLGWQDFTKDLISLINNEKTNTVFILWGKDAAELIPLIDSSKHFILKAAHPSPLSASKGFFGCKHFSKTNNYLVSVNKTPIDWKLNT